MLRGNSFGTNIYDEYYGAPENRVASQSNNVQKDHFAKKT